MDKRWRNQLVFPIVIGGCLLYFLLLKNLWFLLIMSYFILIICYKKQVTLGLLSLFVAFCFLVRGGLNQGPPPPIEKTLTLEARLYPDTIQVRESFVTMEARMPQGEVFLQYPVKDKEEGEAWRYRRNKNQTIQVKGVFKEAETARNLHGFNRQWYEWTQNKIGTFRIEKIMQEKTNSKWHLGRQFRAMLIDWVEVQFPSKLGTYLKALLLGYRDQEFQEIREAYNSSGILHLFSISGMHISIFFGWCFSFFRRSRLTFEEFCLPFIALMFLLVILFGQGLSIWRGTLMYLVNFLLKEKHIHLSALDCFSIVLFFLLLIEPKSFLQTSGILSIVLSLIILISSESRKNSFLYSIEVSFLASPILMFFFYEIPLLGGVLTAIVAPIFAFFLLPSLVFLFIWSLFPLPTFLLYAGMTKFLNFLEDGLSFSRFFMVITGKPSIIFVLSILILGLACYPFLKWKRFFFCLLFLYLLLPRFPLQSSVSFVDVGQGDSIVFQSFGNRQVYVIDTGGKVNYFSKEKTKKNADYTLIPFLKGEGIRQIDGLFLTHGDFDHMGDLEELLTHFLVKNLYIGEGALQHNNMVNLNKALLKETKIIELRQGQQVGDTPKFEVLAPVNPGSGENKDSVVLATKVGEVQFLLMGDLEEEGERRLIQAYPQLQTDVLKIGHHGSQTSSTEVFLQQVQAKHGIVSCGVKNQFKHPHPDVLERLTEQGIEVLRTDQHGMIRYEWSMRQSIPSLRKLLETP